MSRHRLVVMGVLLACGWSWPTRTVAQSPPPGSGLVPPVPRDLDVASTVDRALVFLALSQQADGSVAAPQAADTALTNRRQNTAAFLLAFLSAGHSPNEGRFGRVVARATDFLLSTAPGRDALTDAEVLLALSQVLGVEGVAARQIRIREQVEIRVRALIELQRSSTSGTSPGAWLDESGRPDALTTAACIVAVRAAQGAGVAVPEFSPASGLAYLLTCRHATGAFADRPDAAVSVQATLAAVIALRAERDPMARPSTPIPPELPIAVDALLQLPREPLARWHALYAPTLLRGGAIRPGVNPNPPPSQATGGPPDTGFFPALGSQSRDGSFPSPADSGLSPLNSTLSSVFTLTSPNRLLPGLRR